MQQIKQSGRMSQEALLKVWRDYKDTASTQARDRLVFSLAPIVKSIVYSKIREIPAHREVDDFISCGLEAVIRSIDRYDPDKGATLEQFAWTRIYGAVLDELRRFDWAPRSLRRLEREMNRARQRFSILHGRAPTRHELSAALAISEGTLATLRDDIERSDVGSLNALVLGEAGEILGVSESRVCQIHGLLKRGLRERLEADATLFLEVA